MIQPFTTLPTIDGFDVIDADTGRAVDHRESLHSANGVAFRLNNAAAASQRELEHALGVPRKRSRSGTNVANSAPRQGKRP